jgi:hypothetical protein
MTTNLDKRPDDVHEWVSLDVDGDTYLFDLTYLTSNWTCIFGDGCQGVLTEAAPELVHGCCSYGAHFSDKEDRKKTAKLAEMLEADEWQYQKKAKKLGGPIYKNEHGEWVTRVVDGACIFLNRTGFGTGPGCSLHQAALARDERPLDWKPHVCWLLPLRLEEKVDDNDHRTYTLREWKRRDWGEGGFEFHWWCTEEPDAFVATNMVYQHSKDEIVELIGEEPYAALADYLDERGTERILPHPAVRKRT